MIDIPIGLRKEERNERKCDLEARKLLGAKRGSSVFPVPCRDAVYCDNYQTANTVNKLKVGRGLSKQTWGIVPKIREVDEYLRSGSLKSKLFKESHPEVAFAVLNDFKPMMYSKKTKEGHNERLEVLKKYDSRVINIYQTALQSFLRKEVGKDDILDAICMAITGVMIKKTEERTLPIKPEKDEYGLMMKISYFG